MHQAPWLRRIGSGITTLALVTAVAGPVGAKEDSGASASDTAMRPWLGVQMQPLTDELRDEFKYQGQGVVVARVVPDSPADKAGLKHGDVITSFDTRSVDSPAALSDRVAKSKAGQSVQLRIVRDGKTQTLTARLAEQEEEPDLDDQPGHDMDDMEIHLPHDLDLGGTGMWGGMGRGRLGVRVESLNADLGSYFGVPDGKGVLIVEVMKDTPAEKAELKAGDVITRVGDRAVEDAEELVRALPEDAGKVPLSVVRKGAKRTVQVELDRPERAVRIRRGGPDMIRVRDFQPGPELRRELEDLRRQVEELRREIDRMKK